MRKITPITVGEHQQNMPPPLPALAERLAGCRRTKAPPTISRSKRRISASAPITSTNPVNEQRPSTTSTHSTTIHRTSSTTLLPSPPGTTCSNIAPNSLQQLHTNTPPMLCFFIIVPAWNLTTLCNYLIFFVQSPGGNQYAVPTPYSAPPLHRMKQSSPSFSACSSSTSKCHNFTNTLPSSKPTSLSL